MKTIVFSVMTAAAGCTMAQNAAPVVLATPAGEPAVQRTVVEDSGSRIEELRVRGQTQRISVQPKVGNLRAFEIITSDGSRTLTDSHGGGSGATGKRVWNVLSF
jgi:hypothetical protein